MGQSLNMCKLSVIDCEFYVTYYKK